jgi:hypothetical protein
MSGKEFGYVALISSAAPYMLNNLPQYCVLIILLSVTTDDCG